MPQLDTSTFTSQIFWLVIAFLLLFAVVRGVAAPRLTGMAAARAAQRDGDFAAAEAARAHEKARDAAFHAELDSAHATARTTLAAANDTARDMAAARLKALGEALRARSLVDEAKLDALRVGAEADLPAVADDAARDLVRRLTGAVA